MNATPTFIRDEAERSGDIPLLRGGAVRPLDGAIDCISQKVRTLYDWWRHAGGGSPPDWSEFDVTEHRSVVSNLFLVKRLAPGNWAFSLKGESVQAILPSRRLPHSIAELEDAQVAMRLTAYYEQVAATGRCHLVSGTINNDRGERLDIESIDCPFVGGASGGTTILGALELVGLRAASVG